MKKLNRNLKIKTELRADSMREINRLQDKINVGKLDQLDVINIGHKLITCILLSFQTNHRFKKVNCLEFSRNLPV